MARAHSIWVVLYQFDFDADEPISGFTVKHELITWLRASKYINDRHREYTTIVRLTDGRGEEQKQRFTVDEILRENA